MAPALNKIHPKKVPHFFVYFSHVQRNAALSKATCIRESGYLQVKYINLNAVQKENRAEVCKKSDRFLTYLKVFKQKKLKSKKMQFTKMPKKGKN